MFELFYNVTSVTPLFSRLTCVGIYACERIRESVTMLLQRVTICELTGDAFPWILARSKMSRKWYLGGQ